MQGENPGERDPIQEILAEIEQEHDDPNEEIEIIFVEAELDQIGQRHFTPVNPVDEHLLTAFVRYALRHVDGLNQLFDQNNAAIGILDIEEDEQALNNSPSNEDERSDQI